jgi:hypothetical protein
VVDICSFAVLKLGGFMDSVFVNILKKLILEQGRASNAFQWQTI